MTQNAIQGKKYFQKSRKISRPVAKREPENYQ
jgi:hypothetical protein